jgi:hypothetical protein
LFCSLSRYGRRSHAPTAKTDVKLTPLYQR